MAVGDVEREEPPGGSGRSLFARGELGAAGCAVALLVSMFALKWYGVDGIPGRSPKVVSTVDAWHGLTVLSWFMLLTIALALGSVALHLSQRGHGARTDTSLPVALAATATATAVAYRVLVHLPAPKAIVDQKLGALIGLACALGLAGCAWQAVADGRARRAAAPPPEHRRRRGAARVDDSLFQVPELVPPPLSPAAARRLSASRRPASPGTGSEAPSPPADGAAGARAAPAGPAPHEAPS